MLLRVKWVLLNWVWNDIGFEWIARFAWVNHTDKIIVLNTMQWFFGFIKPYSIGAEINEVLTTIEQILIVTMSKVYTCVYLLSLNALLRDYWTDWTD